MLIFVTQIKLNDPFNDVDPVQFKNTPTIGSKKLIGIVGYPYDISNGENMYAHFLWVTWNLEKAKRDMLQYSIDTYKGKPTIGVTVLFDLLDTRSIRRRSTTTSRHLSNCRTCQTAEHHNQCQLQSSKWRIDDHIVAATDILSVGVHAYGGEPNEASVIGPAGSVFEDFVLAIRVRDGTVLSDRVRLSRGLGLYQLPGFGTLTVDPPGSKANTQLTHNVRRPQIPRRNPGLVRDNHLPAVVTDWTDD